MTTLAEIEAAAFALPEEDRVELGRRLVEGAAVDSPDAPPPGILAADAEGVRAAERRLEAYRRGELKAVPHEEVMRKADAVLEAARREQEAARAA
ncbi:addiction module protein [Alienimonas chondri]|uniref:Addiction module protein n=1 Tax=Alienimonas chondri TaxID=2681879 RepID=A0ABX1VAG5_9PLAN|nr:addiction module protein [Alienimonas chondri]NNJ25049.1 hypothetical protein [Alienimonas chondri]